MRSVIIVVLLAIAVAVVGVLQYRWIGEVSSAEEQRARAALEFAARNFAEEIDREMARTTDAFSRGDDDDVVSRYDAWLEGAPNARLIRGLWLLDIETHQLTRVDLQSGSLHPLPAWPAELAPARARFETHPLPAFVPEIPALTMPLRPRGPKRGEEALLGGGFLFGPPVPPPAIVVQLDRDYLTRHWLPQLAKRYFGRDYDVAVSDGRAVVYRSAAWNGSNPDGEWPLFRVPRRGRGPEHEPRESESSGWQLKARPHGAPLAEAVALTRRRNLAISFAILAILIGSIVLLGVVARRANRQRLQQLQFVAGITHELNTPLAAIDSAGQNLADGVVVDPDQTKRYGAMIVKEARRLSDTVAQVLDYADLQTRTTPKRVVPVDLVSVIDDAIAHSRWLAEERGVEVEVDVPRELPVIDGDPGALGRALQNLIVNAIRHGGSGKWVGVRASVVRDAVCITIEDRGKGIPSRDMPHLFEPFYRGAESGRVRGSGLGLAIVAQVARAHGGSVSIEKRRERGAAFTIRLPLRTAASNAEIAGQHV